MQILAAICLWCMSRGCKHPLSRERQSLLRTQQEGIRGEVHDGTKYKKERPDCNGTNRNVQLLYLLGAAVHHNRANASCRHHNRTSRTKRAAITGTVKGASRPR